jgi:hypothetical protein
VPEKKPVLEEEERRIIPERTVRTTTAMRAIQIGEGIKMTTIDVPDMMIIVEEMNVMIVIVILEDLTGNGTERIDMTMTGPAGAEVENSQSLLVVLRPQNDRLPSNPPPAHALALGPSPLRLSTRLNRILLILGC